MNTVEQPTKTPPRPLGVWLFTLAIAVYLGLYLPAGAVFVTLRSYGQMAMAGWGLFLLTLHISFGLAVLTACFAAWKGSDLGRKCLIGVLVLRWVVNYVFLYLAGHEEMVFQGMANVTNILVLASCLYFLVVKSHPFYAGIAGDARQRTAMGPWVYVILGVVVVAVAGLMWAMDEISRVLQAIG